MKKIIKQLLRENLLTEMVSDITYHFNYLNRTEQILKSNKINLAAAFGSYSDKIINKNKLFFLSTTSSRSSNVGYAASLPKRDLVRITLNGRLLNQNYKSTRVDYWNRPKDPKDPMYNTNGVLGTGKSFYRNISRQDELEDRFISDKDEIKPANKYIISIEVLNGGQEEIERVKFLCDKLGIPFYAYDNEAYFDASAKNKAINVIGKDVDSESDNRERIDTDLIAYLGFKDEELKQKIYNDLVKLGVNDIDKIKDAVETRINDKLNYYLRTDDDYYVNDFTSSMNSNVHNNRSSSNELDRYLIKQLGLDMKKHKVSNIKDYLKYKIWKGKKTQTDFNKEFIENINKFINNSLKENIDYRNLTNNKSFDINGEYYENIMKYPPFVNFLNKFVSTIKKYYYDYIINNEDMFKYSYVLSRDYMVTNLKLDKTTIKDELNTILNDLDWTSNDVRSEDVYSVIFYVMNDLDTYQYDEIKKMQSEYQKQWN